MSKIHITSIIEAPLAKVWKYWTNPEHIVKWAFASDDWECTNAENDLTVGGSAKTIMAAKDGSASVEIEMTYTVIEPEERIEYTMNDGRKVITTFIATYDGVLVEQWFEAETENTTEVQKAGWQAVLNNFSTYTEEH